MRAPCKPPKERLNQCQPHPPVTQEMREDGSVSTLGSRVQASAQWIRSLGGSEASKSEICTSTSSHNVRSIVYDQHFLLKRNKWEHIQVRVKHLFRYCRWVLDCNVNAFLITGHSKKKLKVSKTSVKVSIWELRSNKQSRKTIFIGCTWGVMSIRN